MNATDDMRRILVVRSPRSRDHETLPGHPESNDRLDAVERGIARCAPVAAKESRAAERAEISAVHGEAHIDAIRAASKAGGGWVDPDTYASEGTYTAALHAAGAGLVAIDALEAETDLAAAFVATRPPGHHATAHAAMGFCFFNNIAVAAARLVRKGHRVAIVDWDAHHGNGTQSIFWDDDRVLYASVHQQDLYPGSGHLHERGPISGHLTTVNLPLPAGATGEHYLELFDEIIGPRVERFAPDWVLVSCGFDAHVRDPLAEMALEANDFALLARRVAAWGPAGRLVLFFEGGYDLPAIEDSTAAVMTTLQGVTPSRPPTGGGPGASQVAELRRLWSRSEP